MSFRELIKKYKWKLGFTVFLLFSESLIAILFPLFIGFAVDDAISASYTGTIYLVFLGLTSLIIGSARRFFDSRLYAKIYVDHSMKILEKIPENEHSKKTARLSMLRELVNFMEFSLPEIISSVVGVFGVIIIIGTLNIKILIASIITAVLVFSVYLLTKDKTIRYNLNYNDELESQVDIISNKGKDVKNHLKKLMVWNIKLSDLETLNFFISWLVLLSFLVLSIMFSISDGVSQYGVLLAIIMYVFQYIQSIANLPLFYQQWLRLVEIKERLKNT